MNRFLKYTALCWGLGVSAGASAQEMVHYSGTTVSNVDYHHGQLAPVVGVHNIQVLRANREHPELAEGSGWTYNHAPMLAYWNKTFYLEYLSDKVGESVPPGQTLLSTSKDGYHWAKPVVVFPPYRVPDGTKKEGHEGVAKDLFAVMHQRMGFYVSKAKRLLVLGFYGICLDPHDDPNDGKGIGRVVREIHADGSWGPIYFLHYNPAWNAGNTSYPYYTSSSDKGFIADCNELMATPLMMMQWVEETDRKDPLIPLQKEYKAFNFYHLPDGRAVGLWKNALTGISKDEGKTWSAVTRAPHFVNANAKIWGQKTSDGHFSTVYNPSEFRWPLAISTSSDGLDYTNLLLVQGEISTCRYGGNYKSYGPQYVRGIEEGNGIPPDGNMWVTYSMNKEDIWVGKIPVPVTDRVDADVNDVFDSLAVGKELSLWNIYSPLWAPVSVGGGSDGKRCLILKDEDPYDFAMAERAFPVSRRMQAEFSITPGQNDHGQLQIEFQDAQNIPAMRMSFEPNGELIAKAGARTKSLLKYTAGTRYVVRVLLDMDTRMYTVNINRKNVLTQLFFAPVLSFGHVVFRTGEARHYPTAESPAEETEDKPHAGDKSPAATFEIHYLKTSR
ncbi:MAG: six-hairpin glycosidase [Bacteroidetes bacterium]|nr:six-hairpin glycosidase [Bacteroidota bacterium]